jgi:hypothetical protein
MRIVLPALMMLAYFAAAAPAEAASCSSFATIKAFSAEKSAVKIAWKKGKVNKYFPKPEGTPPESSKVPAPCKGKVVRETTLQVKATGGRLSVTQVRSNYEGKMMNDADDVAWLGKKLEQLAADETEVVIVVRPGMGKDAGVNLTTIYLPITDPELAEIKRLEEQAEDIEG